MEADEYKRMYEIENSFWFYVSLHSLVVNALKNSVSKPNIRLLDAGCGTGRLLELLKHRTKPVGIDISPDAFKYAKRRGLDNLTMANVSKLPFKENTFDAVTSMDVLYHKRVGDDNAALREFNRVLKHGGVLVISVAALDIMRGDHDKVVHTRKRYNRGELTSKLEESGFQIIRGGYRLFFLSLPILIIRRARRFLKGNGSPASDLKPLSLLLNTLLIWLQLFENTLSDYINLPFGSSLFFVLKKIR